MRNPVWNAALFPRSYQEEGTPKGFALQFVAKFAFDHHLRLLICADKSPAPNRGRTLSTVVSSEAGNESF
jgi:hypothetical protein